VSTLSAAKPYSDRYTRYCCVNPVGNRRSGYSVHLVDFTSITSVSKSCLEKRSIQLEISCTSVARSMSIVEMVMDDSRFQDGKRGLVDRREPFVSSEGTIFQRARECLA
jgi:hypothetical protein